MNNEKLQKFGQTYAAHVQKAILAEPAKYRIKDALLLTSRVMKRISAEGIDAVEIKTNPFKATAASLGIKNTYKAWKAFFDGE